MSSRRLLLSIVLLRCLAQWPAESQPLPLETLRNTPLFLPGADLTTNGVPGLTNLAPHLMVSAVSATSMRGGSVALVNTQAWVNRFEGPQHYPDSGAAAAVDSTGNLLVVGNSFSVAEAYDAITIKYSTTGTALWTNRYNGSPNGDDFGWRVGTDAEDNVYVAAGSVGPGGGNNVVVLKYSSGGMPIWTNRYSSAGTNNDYPAAFAVHRTGNSCLLVMTYGPSPAAYVTLVYDPLGHAMWTNVFHGPAGGPDYPQAMAMDDAGNVWVTGNSQGVGLSGSDIATIKYSRDGTPLWTNRYDGDIADVAANMTLDRAGNAIVAGDSLGVPGHRYFLVKYASDGIPLWTNVLPAPSSQGGGVPMVVADLHGNVLITGGSAEAANFDDVDLTIVKLTGDGLPVWTNRFRDVNIDNPAPAGTALDTAGNFYLSCHSTGVAATNIDYVTVKYSAAGVAQWTNRYDGTGHLADHPQGLAVDDAGNVYVTGQSRGGPGDPDFTTVKYCDYVRYSPPADFVGTDSFEFSAVDPVGNTTTGLATVVVLPPSLQFNTVASGLGSTAEGMRLQVDGARGSQPVVLSGSTNLLDWERLSTNLPVLGSARFLDATVTNFPRRFYRAVQAP